MKLHSKILVVFLIAFFTGNALFAEKIGKINVGLLTALHPKMALFDFFRVGFLQIPFGLSDAERINRINNSYLNAESEEKLKKQIEDYDIKINDICLKLDSIIDKEGISNPSFMSEESRDIYENEMNKLYSLQMERLDCEYKIAYPAYTIPSETTKILKEIEKEITETINKISEKKEFDVVLNSSLPVSFNYPFKYHSEAKYNLGPAGIDQSMFYTVLSTPEFDRYTKYSLDLAIRDWLSMVSRPEVQDVLPVKPWPLVMKGGEDILPDALKEIYEVNNISSNTYSVVLDALKQLNMVETNEK